MKKTITNILWLAFLSGNLFAQAPKKVILEDYTGAWCGYCPRGLTVSNQVENLLPNVIALGIHQGSSPSSDAMATTLTNAICSGMTTGFPTGGVDRVKWTGTTSVGVSTNTWMNYCNQRLNASAPLNVWISSTYDQPTRLVNVTVTADFVAAATGSFRMSCLLVEDSVTGTGAGYDQHNYMGVGCGATDPNSPWYTFPCTITGYNHRHVVRTQLANNIWGEYSFLPPNITAGQTFTKSFSYTLPASWDDTQMEIVAFVSRYGTADSAKSILNSNRVELGGSVLGISNPSPVATVSSLEQNYPNPFSDFTNIRFTLNGASQVTLKVYDLLGKEITTLASEKLSGGEYNYYWNGSTASGEPVKGGLYFYRLSTDNQVFTRQMTLIR